MSSSENQRDEIALADRQRIAAAARIAAIALGALILSSCGETRVAGPPTSPSSPSIPGGACGAIGAAIVNGSDCSNPAATSVVLLNVRDNTRSLGFCSGTVIAPRAVLTAAHCLTGGVTIAQIFLGVGPAIAASSFSGHPDYREYDRDALDVGVLLFDRDLGRRPIPLLSSRDARVSEVAVIAGWGRSEYNPTATLRAGLTSITAVGPTLLQTQSSATGAATCAGDSGGPLLLSEGGAWAVAGITSVGRGLCSAGTDSYANVRNPSITSFILSHVPDAGQL